MENTSKESERHSDSKSQNCKAVTFLLEYLKSKLHLYYEVQIGTLDTDVLPEVVARKTTESGKQIIILNANHQLVKEVLYILDSHSNIPALAKDMEKLETEMEQLDREREWCDNLPWEVQCGTGYCDANQSKISANYHAQSDKEKKIREEFDLLSQNNETFQQLLKQAGEATASWIKEEIEEAEKRYEQNRKPSRSLAETPAREGDVRIKSAGCTQIIFSPEDEEKIKDMSKKEAIKYRKELIAQGKFTKKWIPPEDFE